MHIFRLAAHLAARQLTDTASQKGSNDLNQGPSFRRFVLAASRLWLAKSLDLKGRL